MDMTVRERTCTVWVIYSQPISQRPIKISWWGTVASFQVRPLSWKLFDEAKQLEEAGLEAGGPTLQCSSCKNHCQSNCLYVAGVLIPRLHWKSILYRSDQVDKAANANKHWQEIQQIAVVGSEVTYSDRLCFPTTSLVISTHVYCCFWQTENYHSSRQ